MALPLPDFDVEAAHKYFAADCFNKAWTFIEMPERTPEDDRMMVALTQASLYHWRQRPDCGPKQLSIGYWQTSRVYALIGNASEAKRYGEAALSYSGSLGPFYQGYAHECLARAAQVAGDREGMRQHAAKATELAREVTRVDDRETLLSDLRDFVEHPS